MRKAILAVFALILAALAADSSGAGSNGEPPRRIVSFNACADQLLLALADPEQIAGLSPYAADPSVSVMADKGKAYPRLDWQAETTIGLAPDLVLVGPIDRVATRRMLQAQGVRVVEIELVTDLSAARAQILQVADLLGHPERGRLLAQAFDAARTRLAHAPRLPFRTALAIERSGYAAGPRSLTAALLAEAGLRPPAGSPFGYGGYIPLEDLLVLDPDLLVLEDPHVGPTDQGALYLTHPALQRLYPPQRRLGLPHRLQICGGPSAIAALDHLGDEMRRLAAAAER